MGATHVVAYLRVSTETQLDGYGLEAQEASVRDFCVKNELTIAAIFREEGVSGKNDLDNRVALVELNDYCDENGITIIVIPELSRLARDLMVQESIIRDWEKRSWRVLSVKEPDLAGNDPTRKFIRQVLGAVNEYDRAMIVARMRAGRMAKARSGAHAVGKVPYGYASYAQNGKRQRRIDDLAANVVKSIFAMRGRGMSLQAIADELNAQSLPAPRSDIWRKSTIAAMLKNVKYRGDVEYRENGETLVATHNDDLRVI